MDMPHYGINRVDLDRILRSLGGFVEDVPRTGEIRYKHPLMKGSPKCDGRRKDATRHMVRFVRSIIAQQTGRSAAA